MTNKTIDNLSKKIYEIGESGKSIISDPELQEKINKVRSDTERVIRKHPLASIAVGLAVGFLIGKLFRRD